MYSYISHPRLIILPIEWLPDAVRYYSQPRYSLFTRNYSLHELIQFVTSLPAEVDMDPPLWDSFEVTFEEEVLNSLDLDVVTEIVETVVEQVYSTFTYYLGREVENYLFFKWIDSETIALARRTPQQPPIKIEDFFFKGPRVFRGIAR